VARPLDSRGGGAVVQAIVRESDEFCTRRTDEGPAAATCYASSASKTTRGAVEGGARAVAGYVMASRMRLAVSGSVTTARTWSLPPQRTQDFSSTSNVLASSVAHGTLEVAA
jgi:hypothetical protein